MASYFIYFLNFLATLAPVAAQDLIFIKSYAFQLPEYQNRI